MPTNYLINQFYAFNIDSNTTKRLISKFPTSWNYTFVYVFFKAKMVRFPSVELKTPLVLSLKNREVSQKPERQMNLGQDMTLPFERNKRKHSAKSMKLSVPQAMSFF